MRLPWRKSNLLDNRCRLCGEYYRLDDDFIAHLDFEILKLKSLITMKTTVISHEVEQETSVKQA